MASVAVVLGYTYEKELDKKNPPIIKEYVCVEYGPVQTDTVHCDQWAWVTMPQYPIVISK